MIRGFLAYGEALSFLRLNKIRWILWFPLGITLLVFFGGFKLTTWFTDFFHQYFSNLVGGESWLGAWQDLVGEIVFWIIWVIMRVLLYFVMAFLGGTIILVLMTPFLAYTSELIAKKMGAAVPEFSLLRFLRDVGRGISISIKNGVLQIALSLLCFVVGFVPVIGVASPFLIIIVNAYFFGFSFIDYSLERQDFDASKSTEFVWKNRILTTELGFPFALWMLIPFIGPITSGFVALLGTVAATMALQSENSGLKSNDNKPRFVKK